jgi:ABC-type bacteriocin/lantibiotic exporter with double-glycine peptidase domain
MAAVTLVIMFLYSVKLALIVVSIFLIYCAVRLAFFWVLRSLNENAIQMRAKETSTFVESLTILFLDEATAHLDSGNERQISEHLRALNITRISIAHRSEMTQGADLTVRVAGQDRAPVFQLSAASVT